jgi:hypothetical protein
MSEIEIKNMLDRYTDLAAQVAVHQQAAERKRLAVLGPLADRLAAIERDTRNATLEMEGEMDGLRRAIGEQIVMHGASVANDFWRASFVSGSIKWNDQAAERELMQIDGLIQMAITKCDAALSAFRTISKCVPDNLLPIGEMLRTQLTGAWSDVTALQNCVAKLRAAREIGKPSSRLAEKRGK